MKVEAKSKVYQKNELTESCHLKHAFDESFKKDKKTVNELREEKKYLENIIESSLDPIVITDCKGYIKKINRSFLKLIGCIGKKEVYGKHISVFAPAEEGTYRSVTGESVRIDKEFFDNVKKMASRLVEGGRITNWEIYFIRSDNMIIPIEENVVYLYGEKGNKTGAVGILRDITERKKTERILQKTKEFLENVLESSRDGILIADRRGVIVSVNSAMERMTGLTKKQLTGKHASSLVVDERDMRKHILSKTSALFKRGFCSYEAKHKKDDGTSIDVECNVSVTRDDSGDIIGGISIIRDISDRNKMERQLRHSHKMEAVGTLAGGIAHDFNNILAAIVGFAEMALHHLPEKNRAGMDLDQVLKAAYRGEALVDQILAFSRQNERGRKPTRLKYIIKEVLKLLRATLPVTIELQYNMESDATVMADPTQIHQLMMNLCINAANAMREKGGILQITLSSVIIDSARAEEFPDLSSGLYIELMVSDTGSGIDPKIVDRIFDPFFTTKKLGEGTGMGLSVALGIVKSHAGEIFIDNIPGKGCTFHVLLPAVKEVTEKTADQNRSIPTGNERILFVDDEEALVEMAKKMLNSLGYEVVAEKNSIQALEVFQKDPFKFDLVITDQTMPHMTGYNMAEQLLCIRPDIPIILCTGFSETVPPEKALKLGIREYIKKPLNRRLIAETIRSALTT